MKICKHYLSRYEKFIAYYKGVISEGFVEKHHILPQCLGGGNEPENLVALPVRAHFIAHALLHKAYPDNKKLAHAFAMMIVNNPNQKRKCSSRLYQMAKSARSSAMKGVSRPEWVKEKLRKPKSTTENYKKPKSKEHIKNISKSLKDKPKSDEAVAKMVVSMEIHYAKRTIEYNKKKEMYRELFLKSNMTKKQFSTHHGVNHTTMKKYLKGL